MEETPGNTRTAYRCDLRDIRFLLWEQFRADRILDAHPVSREFDRATVDEILERAATFATSVLGTCYQSGDSEGCTLMNGRVRTPVAFTAAWQAFHDQGWSSLAAPRQYDGMGVPTVVVQTVNELFMGANPSFMNYSGFCAAVLHLIEKHGSAYLKAHFGKALATSRWSASLCMTEPDAGTDIGMVRTRATCQPDGTYLLTGTKTFISAGMHDLAENIVYLVLARTGPQTSGTAGLSCFVVPRFRVLPGGEFMDNDVRCVGLEQKMGLHGCATVQLAFGTDDRCRGYLLGESENQGLRQLTAMMSMARIATAIYGLGMASSAYLNAVHYALERVQGTDARLAFNPRAARVPIIRHTDVKRMLLEMKSKAEGLRALLTKLHLHQTQLHALADVEGGCPDRDHHDRMFRLLTPIAKAYTSDQAWRISELAIQVYGGHGYVSEHPVEQYARDCKILSIWEGTNYIQAADLFRDKLAMGRPSALLDAYLHEISGFLAGDMKPHFERERQALRAALSDLVETHRLLGEWVRGGQSELALSFLTRFLEMMGEVTVAWLLLEGALIADDRLASASPTPADVNFYQGKVQASRFFLWHVLPSVSARAALIRNGDAAAVEATAGTFVH